MVVQNGSDYFFMLRQIHEGTEEHKFDTLNRFKLAYDSSTTVSRQFMDSLNVMQSPVYFQHHTG